MNFEFLYYMKNFNFWHNMLYSTNSIVISIMDLFVHSKNILNFACVSPCDSKAKIKYFVTEKFIASIT